MVFGIVCGKHCSKSDASTLPLNTSRHEASRRPATPNCGLSEELAAVLYTLQYVQPRILRAIVIPLQLNEAR